MGTEELILPENWKIYWNFNRILWYCKSVYTGF